MFSFLSSAISTVSGASWQYYIIGGLALSLSASVWYNKHQIDEYAQLNASYSTLSQSLKDSQNSLQLRDSSCKIDDNSVVELEAEKKVISEKSDSIDQEFLKLKQQAVVKAAIIPKEDAKNVSNESSNYLPDDGKLSPAIVSLLTKSYCSVADEDPTCTATGQPPH